MQPKNKSNSPSPWGAKATGGGNQTAQYSSMNSGAVSSLAPPTKKGVSSADRLSLPPGLKQFAVLLKDKKFFGEKDFETIMNNADDVGQLKQWMSNLGTLYIDYDKKEKISKNPGFNANQNKIEAQETSVAKSALESQIKEYLTHVAGSQNGASAWSLGTASTVAVQQAVEAVPVADPTLPSTADFRFQFNNHGDFISNQGNVKKSELSKYIKENIGEFIFKAGASNEESQLFTLELGQTKKKHWKDDPETWFITIRYFPGTNRALVTHFGPFGEDTGVKVK